MDAVLGLSVTPSAVGLVLVEGQDADGATVDGGAFEIRPGRRSTPMQTCEQAAAAVRRTEAIAATHGHRLHSIGVTWSDDADIEASLLLKSLTDCGFDNVVPVRLPEATEALAWGVAEVIGEDITAVCLIEPESVIALIVHTREGAVQTAVNRSIDSEEALVRWLSTVFTRADWRPQALVVVGSGGDVDALMPRLEAVLSVPVFAPAEAELALARGAALASAHTDELIFADDMHVHDTHLQRMYHREEHRPSRTAKRRSGQAGPLAMLVAGAVTFVVSVSVAISMEITPRKDMAPPEARPAAKSSPEAAAADAVPLAPPRRALSTPIVDSPLAPPPEAPVDDAPPPVELPAEPETGVTDLAVAPVDALPPEAQVPPVPGAPIEGLPPDPAAVAPPVAPVPAEPPTIRERIRDRLSGLGGGDAPPEAAPPEAFVAPPPEAPAPPPADAVPPPDAPPLLPPS